MPHPVNCGSYRRRSLLLTNTLASILRQREPDIVVVVVANEVPQCDLPNDARLELVIVPFPPATSPAGHPTATVGIYDDKGAKLAVGTAAAIRRHARHVMFVDSDDYIHRDLAGLVAEAPDSPGWYSDAGFFHVRGARTVTAYEHGFHQRNGSTHVLRADLLDVPADLDTGLSRDRVLERLGRDRTVAIMGKHRPIVEYYDDMGQALTPLPFPSAIWEIGNGENFSQVLAAAGRTEPVSGPISQTYGLGVPSRPTALVRGATTMAARLHRRVMNNRGPS